MSSTERAAKQPDTPSVPRVHRVASGVRSVRAVWFPRTCASRREDGVNCVERPVDQIHDFSVLRSNAERVSQVLHDTRQESRQEGKKGEDGELEKMRPPPLRAKEEVHHNGKFTDLYKDEYRSVGNIKT